MKRTIVFLFLYLGLTHSLSAQLASKLQLGGIASTTFWQPGETVTPLTGGNINPSFNNRFLLLLNFEVDESIAAFAALESWQGQLPILYAAGLNWRVSTKPVFIVRAGKFLAPFGNFLRRRFDSENPLIARPVAYSYRHNVSASILPRNADDLLQTRGSGNNLTYPSIPSASNGLRIFWRETYITGVQLIGENGKFRYSITLANGSLSNTAPVNNTEALHIIGRLLVTPVVGLKVGASYSSGTYLNKNATQSSLASLKKSAEDFRQTVFGADVNYSYGHLEAWGELQRISYNSPFLNENLDAFAWNLEAKYNLSVRIFLAARFSDLRFGEIPDTNDLDGDGVLQEPWDYGVSRLELGLGYRIHRNGFAKIAHQFNRMHEVITGDPSDDLTALQLVVFF